MTAPRSTGRGRCLVEALRVLALKAAVFELSRGDERSAPTADLTTEQEQAVHLALTSKVTVLTGGPGCGKSFTVRPIVELAAAKKAEPPSSPRPAAPPNACPS